MSSDMIEYGKNAWRIALANWKEYLETNNARGFYWEDFNKDGSLISVKISSSLVRLHNEILIQLIIHDITKINA